MTEGSTLVENEDSSRTNNNQSAGATFPPRDAILPNIHGTEIAHSLFGPSVGSCWGNFSCQYHRQQGRLYAASNAVLFYSQLFGFERKVCVYFQDMVLLEAYRSTSIRITTVDSEQHVFKSFTNRNRVVQLLHQLQQGSSGLVVSETSVLNDTSLISDASAINGETENIETESLEQDGDGDEMEEPLEAPPPIPTAETESTPVTRNSLVSSLRGKKLSSRSKSLSCLDNESVVDDAIPSVPPTEYDSSSLGSAPEVEKQQQQGTTAWDEIVKTSQADFKEIALEPLEVSCSLEEFFNFFLADNAPYSTHKYQQDVIGDYDLEAFPWTQEGDALTRTVSFRHPISAKTFGFGPSSVNTSIRQRLRNFGSSGTCIETSSSVEGSPGSDCFTVEDQWLLTPLGPGKISLTVRYETRFSKRTMLKSMIQKSIRQETIQWYKGYADMVTKSLQSEGHARNELTAVSAATEKSVPEGFQWKHGWQLYLLVGLAVVVVLFMVVALLVLAVHVVRLHALLRSLQDEIRQLRTENTASANQIAEAIKALTQNPANECKSTELLQE